MSNQVFDQISNENYSRALLEQSEYNAFSRLQKRFTSDLIALNGGIIAELKSILFTLQNERKTLKKDLKEKFYFITINPSPDVDFNSFKLKVEKYVQRSFIKNYIYTFEQRGQTPEEVGTGFHVHIITDMIVRNKFNMVRDTFSTFKSMVSDKQKIDIRDYPISYREEKIQYLKGEKWDDSKLDAVKINNLFREKYNLSLLYNAT